MSSSRWFFLVLFIQLAFFTENAFAFDFAADVNPHLSGMELAYGPDDVMATPIISFRDWHFFYVKPVFVRYSPITHAVSAGTLFEFYPVAAGEGSFLFFSDKGLNPFFFTGVIIPFSLKTFRVPLGVGFHAPLYKDIYCGVKVVLDTAVAPVVYPVLTWDVSFEYKIKP